MKHKILFKISAATFLTAAFMLNPVVVHGADIKAPEVKELFRNIFGYSPSNGESTYWINRTEQKPTAVELAGAMQYQKQLNGTSPTVEAEEKTEDLVNSLNRIIRANLGAQYLTSDIWHYYAERLRASVDDSSHIKSLSKLREVMAYWKATQPDKPRGLTKAEQEVKKSTPGTEASLMSQINQAIRANLGAKHVTEYVWNYYAHRVGLDASSKDAITSREKLDAVMKYWLTVKPELPTGQF